MVFVILDNPTNKDSVLDIRVPIFRPGKPPEIKSYMEQFPFPFYIILRDINALPLTLSDALRQWFELVSCLEWSCTKRLLHDSWCPGDWERKRGAFCDIVEVPVARFISSPYGKAELLIIMEFISIWFLSTEVYTDLSFALWLQIITFDSGIWPILTSSRRIGECNPTTRNVGHCDNEELYDSFRSQDHIMTLRWAIQSCPKALFQKRGKVQCYCYEKDLLFPWKGNSFLRERFCTKPSFESESFCNSEMAYPFSRGFNHLSSKDDSNKNYSKLDIEYSSKLRRINVERALNWIVVKLLEIIPCFMEVILEGWGNNLLRKK